MAGPHRPQTDAGGVVFGWLGVRISGDGVWTSGHGDASRYLGPLKDACAGLDERRRSRIGRFISSVLLLGNSSPKDAKLYVAFADGSRYERMLLPWINLLDWPKIAGEVGQVQ